MSAPVTTLFFNVSSYTESKRKNTTSLFNSSIKFQMYPRSVCTFPLAIKCRIRFVKLTWESSGQVFELPCTTKGGLVCLSASNNGECYDYEISLKCPFEQSKSRCIHYQSFYCILQNHVLRNIFLANESHIWS